MTAERADVLIVGGGITGLAAAYFVQKLARAEGRRLRCRLVEASKSLGGKVQTERVNGLVIEQGPDSFLVRKPAAKQLAEELGLGGDLVGTNPHVRKTYMVRRRRLVPLPDGMMLAAPAKLSAYVKSPLFSPWGKLRAGLDLLLPPTRSTDDESLGAFFTRRLGREVAVNLAGPLLSGIYAGDLDQISILATFPQLRQLEQKHGSLIRGLRALQELAGQRSATGSAFLTLRTGLMTLVEALEKALNDVDITTGDPVVAVRQQQTREGNQYEATLASGRQVTAPVVVLTLPAHAAALLLEPFAPHLAADVAGIPYVSTAAVVLVYPQTAATRPLDATGFLVPAHERRVVTGSTWVTQKWPHTTPAGQVLIRCFVGRAGSEKILQQDDESIVKAVAAELRELVGLQGEPTLSRVYRWPRAMPQYVVGHQARLQRIREHMAAWPGMLLAGAGYDGMGLPDCVRQGEEAAKAALAQLRNV